MKSRVVRFVSVGIFNTGFDFLLLNILVFGVGLYKIWANIISTLTAMSLSYLLNHSFVFRDQKARSKRQFLLFISITLFGLLVIQNIIIYLFTHQLVGIANGVYSFIAEPLFGDVFSKAFVQLNFAKALATVATMVWNYELYKRVVFKKQTVSTTSQDGI